MNKTPDSNGASRGLYLQWEGKKVYRQQVPTPRLFDPVEKYSHGEIRDNLLIEGDNLQVLASLKPRYAGMIDVIYIDPPYNLGKDDFRYSDKRFHDPDADDSDAVYVSNEDGGRHTKWLNSIAPRLYMMWQLLHDDRGVMFISINDVELFRLGMLLNEIFGEENWVGTIVWRSNTDNNPTRIAMEHEYILCYAKSKDRLRPRWTNPDSEMKAMLLDAFERLQTETKSTAALTKAFAHFTKENKDALGDLYRYRRIDEHGPYASAADEELQHTKAVEWTHEVERDSLTAGTKNSLGSIATIFCISDEAAQEIHARLDGVVGVPGDIWTSSYERDFVSRSWTWHEGRSTQLSRW
jgi:adenine-specific DNA-methyltransferase